MKKSIFSFFTIFIVMMLLIVDSYATGENLGKLEAKIEVTADKTEIATGDVITFTLKTTNIKNAENDSISAISGVIEWDKDFFEIPSSGTGTATLNTETGDFNCISVVKDGGTNGTIILKVKDSAEGSGVVKFTKLEAGDGRIDENGIATTADQEITIKIKEETPTDPSTPTEEPDIPVDPEIPSEDNDISQTPGDNQTTTDGITVTVGEDDTTANKDYDKAGINMILIAFLIIFAFVSVVIYKRGQKYRDIK